MNKTNTRFSDRDVRSAHTGHVTSVHVSRRLATCFLFHTLIYRLSGCLTSLFYFILVIPVSCWTNAAEFNTGNWENFNFHLHSFISWHC